MKIISFDTTKKAIAGNALIGFVFQFLIRLKGVIILPLIVRYLEKETIGEWRIATTTSLMVFAVVTLNVLDGSGMFFSADTEARRVRIKYYSLLNLVIILTLAVSLLAILALFALAEIREFIFPVLVLTIAVIAKKLAVFLFQMYQKSATLLKINLITEYGAVGLMILLLLLGYQSLWVLVLPIASLDLLLALFILLRVNREIAYLPALNRRFIAQVIPKSLPLIPVFLADWLLTAIGIYVVQIFLGSESAGVYSVMLSIAGIFLALRGTLQFFWFSTCSNLIRNKDILQFEVIFSAIFKAFIFLLFIGLLLVAFFGEELILLFATPDYLVLKDALLLIALGYTFLILSTIWNGILYAQGKTMTIMYAYLISAVVTLVLSLFLVNMYREWGVALAYLVGTLLLVLIMLVTSRDYRLRLIPVERLVVLLIVAATGFLPFIYGLHLNDSIRWIVGVTVMLVFLVLATLSGFVSPRTLLGMFRKGSEK